MAPARSTGRESNVPACRIERLATHGFRNLTRLDIEPGPHFNVIHGENGAGKSNLLEAIYLLGASKSYRNAKTDDLIALGADEARLKMRFSAEHASQVISLALARGRARRVSVDGKRPRSASELRARIPIVIFHPGHLGLSTGGAEIRRSFLDELLEPTAPLYGEARAAYEKALRSRNRLLKDPEVERRHVLPFDALLARHGEVIVRHRRALVAELAPRIEASFQQVVGDSLELEVAYAPRVPDDEAAIRAALEAAFRVDRARGFTAEGPHLDELSLRFGGVGARHHASQGQHRALALSMKIAELDYVAERLGKVPILLLDDVSSELDRTRSRRLFERISSLGGQVFLTTTHPEFILLEDDRVDFGVSSGVVERGR
jgi:DNA replication and repair protein RecF